jgi:sensor histidine kinase YesM
LELLQENLKKEAEKTLKSDSHIGLCNVNSRIRLKFSEDKYGVSIISTYGEGTRVELLTKAIREDQGKDEI